MSLAVKRGKNWILIVFVLYVAHVIKQLDFEIFLFFLLFFSQSNWKKNQELYYIIEIWEIPQTVKTGLVGQIRQLCHLIMCVCKGGNAWIRESGQHMKIMQCILWERPDLLPLRLTRWAWNDLIFNTTFWRLEILGDTSLKL